MGRRRRREKGGAGAIDCFDFESETTTCVAPDSHIVSDALL